MHYRLYFLAEMASTLQLSIRMPLNPHIRVSVCADVCMSLCAHTCVFSLGAHALTSEGLIPQVCGGAGVSFMLNQPTR